MYLLSTLPPEIIDQILSYKDSSFLVIMLWKCGNSSLMDKLSRAVTTVELKDLNWTSTSRWPKCLSRLSNLRSLSIDRAGSLMEPSALLSKEIRSLSSKLKSLALTADLVIDAFHNFAEDGKTLITTKYPRGESTIFNMAESFPELESLDITSNLIGTDYDEDRFFKVEDYAAFPDTLTYLEHDSHFRWTERLPQFLPPGLKQMDIRFNDTLGPHNPPLSLLPRGMTKLRHIEVPTLSDMLALPSTLTEAVSIYFPWTYAMSQALPPLLKGFRLESIDFNSFRDRGVHWCELLPKTIVSLDVRQCPPLDPHAISLLPRSLSSLEAHVSWEDCLSDTVSSLPWPPNITRFEYDLDLLTPPRYHLFPRKLLYLDMEYWIKDPTTPESQSSGSNIEPSESTSASRSLASFFPEAETLSIYRSDFKGVLPIIELPSKLVVFSLSMHAPEVSIPFAFICGHLPATLTTLSARLDWKNFKESDADQMALPLGLEDFSVDRWRISWFPKLPRRLTLLHIENLTDFDETIDSDLELTQHLPPTLVDLEWATAHTFPSDFVFKGKGFCSTLTSLRYLFLGRQPAYASSIFRTIPQSLFKLVLAMKKIDPEDAPFIPQKLSSFEITGGDFDKEHEYLVDSVNEYTWDVNVWSESPELEERRAARVEAARQRSKLYPDPRTLKRFESC